jgi:hypothetical protein
VVNNKKLLHHFLLHLLQKCYCIYYKNATAFTTNALHLLQSLQVLLHLLHLLQMLLHLTIFYYTCYYIYCITTKVTIVYLTTTNYIQQHFLNNKDNLTVFRVGNRALWLNRIIFVNAPCKSIGPFQCTLFMPTTSSHT